MGEPTCPNGWSRVVVGDGNECAIECLEALILEEGRPGGGGRTRVGEKNVRKVERQLLADSPASPSGETDFLFWKFLSLRPAGKGTGSSDHIRGGLPVRNFFALFAKEL